jgi:hypothetical protein
MPRLVYDPATPFGKITAENIDRIIRVKQNLGRLVAAMDSARGDPPDYTKLEGGDFGVAEGQGEAFWNQIVSIKNTVDNVADWWLASVDMGG